LPKLGKKLTSNPFTDMGQGLLEIMEDIYNKKLSEKSHETGPETENEQK
jgi:hypothetical protein